MKLTLECVEKNFNKLKFLIKVEIKKRNYKKNSFKLDESIFSFYKSPKTLKNYIFYFQLVNQCIAFLCIFFIIHASHDMQAHILYPR